MSKKELVSYLLAQNTALSPAQILLSLTAAVLLALLMYFVYRKTFSGVVYSKNFNSTLVLIAVITTLAMLAIGSNLALSLGMVGSLSIIRFRTAIKEPRDIAFLFWAISIGLCCGANMYIIAVLGSVVITALLFAFKMDLYERSAYLLVVRSAAGAMPAEEMEALLKENTASYRVRMSNATGREEEVTYEISLSGRKKQTPQALQKQLIELQGVCSVNFVSYSGEVIG